MNPKIIVVSKPSKYELGVRKHGSHEKFIERLPKDDADTMYQSHLRQKESEETLRRALGNEHFMSLDQLNGIDLDNYLLVSHGGDDSFKLVSHYVDNGMILGVNSDTVLSQGALVEFAAPEFENIVKAVERGDYCIENWTRLGAQINGEKIPPAVSEYVISEERMKLMSNYIIEINGKKERQKSSGILVATGAGSTGWYKSEYVDVHDKDDTFPKTSRLFKYFVRAPTGGRKYCGYSLLEGSLGEGEELKIYSLFNNNGLVMPDSFENIDFSRGKIVTVRLSDKPLHVVKLEGCEI